MLLVIIPMSASPDNLPVTQQITIKSEYSGNAVVNEVTSLKWSTGTFGNMTTYTWQQSANLNKPDQTSLTLLDIERTNQSTTWQLKRTGSTLPGGVTLNDSSIIQPQYLTNSILPSFPTLPLFQPQPGLLFSPVSLPVISSPFHYLPYT
jgi:hypothetical protein